VDIMPALWGGWKVHLSRKKRDKRQPSNSAELDGSDALSRRNRSVLCQVNMVSECTALRILLQPENDI